MNVMLTQVIVLMLMLFNSSSVCTLEKRGRASLQLFFASVFFLHLTIDPLCNTAVVGLEDNTQRVIGM